MAPPGTLGFDLPRDPPRRRGMPALLAAASRFIMASVMIVVFVLVKRGQKAFQVSGNDAGSRRAPPRYMTLTASESHR
jgi:hypothetical protein